MNNYEITEMSILVTTFICLLVSFFMSSKKNILDLLPTSSILSFMMTALYLMMNAPDVAITEVCIGAGIGTIFTILTIKIMSNGGYKTVQQRNSSIAAISTIMMTLSTLLMAYLICDLIPQFGALNNPLNSDVVRYYFEKNEQIIGIPNIVTSVLASFRGYDTFGETIVIFIAGFSVYTILGSNNDQEK